MLYLPRASAITNAGGEEERRHRNRPDLGVGTGDGDRYGVGCRRGTRKGTPFQSAKRAPGRSSKSAPALPCARGATALAGLAPTRGPQQSTARTVAVVGSGRRNAEATAAGRGGEVGSAWRRGAAAGRTEGVMQRSGRRRDGVTRAAGHGGVAGCRRSGRRDSNEFEIQVGNAGVGGHMGGWLDWVGI